MKFVYIAILTLIGFSSYGADVEPNAFDEIISPKLLKEFSTLDESTELKVHKEKKNELTTYSFSVDSYPILGLSITIGPAYSLLPKETIREDRESLSKSSKELEKAIEAKKDELTEKEYEEAKESLELFSAIFSGSEKERYPDLGSQALHTGWTDGDTTIFTTSDKKHDLKIQRIFTEGVFFRVPEMALSISSTYDKTRPNQAGDDNSE
ncbi:MAG: hypothetical protein CML13_13760 [Puniceicoccaceae bacterium]|nr:hypothetical protein [Puniceicoccaceae bacterium]|tara:strand:+ start:210 stop:836 length:627 start_codon:yes stop_codon:yes gene_type:complete